MNFIVKIENILPYIETFSLENGHFTEDDVDAFVCSVVKRDLPDWDYETGASKLVIIPGVEDFVIKIPFDGHYTDYENEDDTEYLFHPFVYGGGSDYRDYCEKELNVTEDVKGHKFEKFVLPVIRVGYWKNYPIYAQPKAELYLYDEENYPSNESLKSVKRMKSEGLEYQTRLPDSWLAKCLDYFDGDEEELKELLDFFDDYGISNDLHNDNIGYYEGHPVLIDYAGYYDG